MKRISERQLDLLQAGRNDFEFQVRPSNRARRMSVSVTAHGIVEVVVPQRTRPKRVAEFVGKHRGWIDAALAEFAVSGVRPEREMPDTIELPATGERFDVVYDAPRTRVANGKLRIAARREDRERCRAEFRKWLQKKARAVLEPWLVSLSERTGLRYQRLQIRAQRTRWGSYSSRGTLSLNLCLLFVSPPLVEQVLLHELCHTRHMNHSKSFWRLVARHAPDFREHERALNEGWRTVPYWLGLH
ncbi:MAG: M48 family metallopeptidase [Gammaproteobacteria bacterium]|nr:M48 family metallopeptidase [Gammaproteobacteria bacterium]NND59313.1 M48 family metallopeptidase [Gammaproteobacteria bacterium]